MRKLAAACLLMICAGCSAVKLEAPARTSKLTGTEFYTLAAGFNWKQRDSAVIEEVAKGNMPSFFLKLAPVPVAVFDSVTRDKIEGVVFVTPDYLCIGSDRDWARVPITPMAAQSIADKLNCFLPTRKIVNDIYVAANVKLEPAPMFAFRDSSVTMYQHHLIVEGQRRGRAGLIAGIKKDVVITGKIARDPKPNRVAIYGWHKLDGKPIQRLYTGHVNWYVDYSHGIRLVYERMKVNGKWMHFKDVMAHPVYKKLICDEEYCDFYKYPY
jgi:hypothetical protein